MSLTNVNLKLLTEQENSTFLVPKRPERLTLSYDSSGPGGSIVRYCLLSL